MPFLVQTLPTNSIIVAGIRPPIISGEPSRVYQAIHGKISRRSDHDTIHLVMDVSQFNYSKRLPLELYIKIMSKLHEHWYSDRTLILWLAVDKTYADMARYFAQKWCLPVYIHTDPADVYARIDLLYGETGEFEKADIKVEQ